MPKNKKNKKYYLIESQKRKWSYGAFPHTDEGLKEAKRYLTALQKKTKEKLEIVEK
tara:strand:+ start:1075 stop:1242 length:168 start_codon:yes stop_codon:yes gene_type:complete